MPLTVDMGPPGVRGGKKNSPFQGLLTALFRSSTGAGMVENLGLKLWKAVFAWGFPAHLRASQISPVILHIFMT